MEGLGHYGFIFLVTQKRQVARSVRRNARICAKETHKAMFSIKMITFRKNAICPSSQKLLTFQNGEAAETDAPVVRRHLEACEFCAAEIEFYAHYPQSEESIERTEIPMPLYELAHALLSNHHKDFFRLNQLLCEPEGVKV